MPKLPRLENRVRDRRERKGWTQDELAKRSGLSRAGVSAIEMGRLVPSASAALALAGALGCRVEDLFRLDQPGAAVSPSWAWPPRREPWRYWKAEVGGRVWLYPAEATPAGVLPHDGIARDGSLADSSDADPSATLVIATCDPAVALLADALRSSGVRLLPLPRSSRAALALLGEGLVHASGMHLGSPDAAHDGNAAAVRDRLGPGFRLLRVARWQEGLCLAPGLGLSTVRSALAPGLRWVGREEGSGARQCLDELLGDRRKPPRRIATDHRGVAEAVRHGWADLGVCVRLPAEESGLDFLDVRRESYDLCFPSSMESDPRLQALIAAVRSPQYRRALAALPGYDPAEAGELVL
ncbi:MAG TPA: substrate-binding domain-containing protein [Isosphaeraceae bacterium]